MHARQPEAEFAAPRAGQGRRDLLFEAGGECVAVAEGLEDVCQALQRFDVVAPRGE
jgi:hypothetical protein